jgi:hypothetical protein
MRRIHITPYRSGASAGFFTPLELKTAQYRGPFSGPSNINFKSTNIVHTGSVSFQNFGGGAQRTSNPVEDGMGQFYRWTGIFLPLSSRLFPMH